MQVVAKQRDDAEKGDEGSRELARSDAVVGQIEMCESDRDEGQSREQDRGQATVEELLAPINKAVVGAEEHETHPNDERPLGSASRPPRAKERRDCRKQSPSEEKTKGCDVE